jgi:FkbM family methyltransferase
MRNLHSLLSALPPFPGKLPLADMLGRMRSTLVGPHASFHMSPGSPFEVDLQDRVQRQMWAGCYEPHVRKCLESLLEDGDIFVDVGAHIGYVTVIAARRVGPQGRVFSFEPDPFLHERLSRNVAHQPWVQTFRCAMWKETGAQIFERASSKHESGWGTLTSVRDLKKGEHIDVLATSLDDWAVRCQVDRIQAIKIDAEGSEASILEGAGDTIARLHPVIIMELNDTVLRQGGASASVLVNHPVLANYTIYGLFWMQLRPLAAQLVASELPSEVLCVPNNQTEMTLGKLQMLGIKLC